MEEKFYVLSFESTNHAIRGEKTLKELTRIITIPTPREISKGCGLSIRFVSTDLGAIMGYLGEVQGTLVLYEISGDLKTGRKARPIYEQNG